MDADPGREPAGPADVDGRVAVVTGAARGIGFAVARLLARAGATVWLSDRDEAALAAAVERCSKDGLDAHGYSADATDPDAVSALFEAAAADRGVDVVVANAGRMTTGRVRDTDIEAWDAGLRDNLTSTYLTSRAALPALERSRHGRLVLLSSGAAFDPRTAAGTVYAVAKSGIAHLARLLAVELAGSGVTVNAVAPGAIDTDMSRGLGAEVLEQYAQRSPMGRVGTPDDVANVVLFLASDLGGYVNGEIIRVAGGP
jgi:3-oxoacyl-[acyl-carrier protein] reductase